MEQPESILPLAFFCFVLYTTIVIYILHVL